MADLSWHVDRGSKLHYVEVGTAQGTHDVELIVDNAEDLTRKDVLLALEKIKQAVIKDTRFTGF